MMETCVRCGHIKLDHLSYMGEMVPCHFVAAQPPYKHCRCHKFSRSKILGFWLTLTGKRRRK